MIAISFLSGEMDILWLHGLTNLFGREVINPKTCFHESIWKRWGGQTVGNKNQIVFCWSLWRILHSVFPSFSFLENKSSNYNGYFTIYWDHHGHVMVLKNWVQTIGNSSNMYGHHPLHSALCNTYEKVSAISQRSLQQERTKSATGTEWLNY